MYNSTAFDPFTGFDVQKNVLAKDYTSFRIGGPMAYFSEPASSEELQLLLDTAKKQGIVVHIIGNGSNILIPDEGVNALFIRIGPRFSDYSFDGQILRAQAGALLSTVARQSVHHGLMGLEWAAGVPGTVGGAVAMNAGAYNGEIKHVITEVTIIENGSIVTRSVLDTDLGYRFSEFAYPKAIVLEALFKLMPDDGKAEERMIDYSARRRAKQPLEFPSAGSTFKRPEGYFAGALIENAGLKGVRFGGAMVSPKHAGFIINVGNATFTDVVTLIEHVQNTVFERFGVLLEPEVKIIK